MVSQKQEELKELRAIERNLSDMQISASCRMPQEKPENIQKKQIEFAKEQSEQIRKDIEGIINSDPDLKKKIKTNIFKTVLNLGCYDKNS